MKKAGYYSSGEFAAKAHITKKTIRYYDEHNILKPSLVNENGARFYTEEDFARLQQVLFLKYLGFSLDEIKEMTMRNSDQTFMSESLHMQLELIEERMDQLVLMKQALTEAAVSIDHGDNVDWSKMLDVVNSSELDQKMKKQYKNSSNISARIHLHSAYAKNKQGWFPWLFEECNLKTGMEVLELGCGDASLWIENKDKIPENIHVTLTDISAGMIRDARKNIGIEDKRFSYERMDAHDIKKDNAIYDVVLANHVLFYCDDLAQVCSEVKRVLKPGGAFICSTYSAEHMKEIAELVTEFDDRIVLSADRLYEVFGKENGRDILQKDFTDIIWRDYEDTLFVTKTEDLVAYVLSCHGNQNRYIVDRYKDFKVFVRNKIGQGFHITKEAGIFFAVKKGS